MTTHVSPPILKSRTGCCFTRIYSILYIEGYVLMGTWNANQDSMDYQRATSTFNNNKSATKALILPTETVQNILYKLPLSIFSVVTVSLPLGSLVFCFITACIFQHELVTETECHVSHKIQSSLIDSASCCLVAMCSPITIHVTLVLVH